MSTATSPAKITASCPDCGHVHAFRPGNIGRRAKCSNCSSIFVIRDDQRTAVRPKAKTGPMVQEDLESADFPVLSPELPQVPNPPAVAPMAPITRPATAESTTPKTKPPKMIGLQIMGAVMFMGGLAAAALGLSGPSDIQLLGFWAIGTSLVSAGIVVSAIARAVQVLSR